MTADHCLIQNSHRVTREWTHCVRLGFGTPTCRRICGSVHNGVVAVKPVPGVMVLSHRRQGVNRNPDLLLEEQRNHRVSGGQAVENRRAKRLHGECRQHHYGLLPRNGCMTEMAQEISLGLSHSLGSGEDHLLARLISMTAPKSVRNNGLVNGFNGPGRLNRNDSNGPLRSALNKRPK